MERLFSVTKKWKWFIASVVLAIALGIFVWNVYPREELFIAGVNYPNSNWFIVDNFQGYQTRLDETKIPKGANGRGQNTTANNTDRISIRNEGYTLFPAGTASSSVDQINRLHVFHRRDGENIFMRAYGTVLEYYDEDSDAWTTLNTGYTDGQRFGFADYNRTVDVTSYVYFGNAAQPFSRWTGVHSSLTGATVVGTTTMRVSDTGDFANTGTVVVCGTEYAYSAKNDTTDTFTIATTTNACASGSGIPEAVQEYSTALTHPRGNIYIAFDNRLLISGIASTSQSVYFSEYGDALDYVDATLVTASTDTDPDIFNLVEGGGAVTGMAMDENSLYIFKRNIIYKVTLTDTDYTVTQLKPFDGRSQTSGLLASGGVFTGGNAVYFATPDNQLMALERVESVDFPQITPISHVIEPTVNEMNFDSANGIVFRDRAYFSVKSDTDIAFNNTVLVWNIKEKIWDSPIVGWNINDFAVYDDGDGEDLYLGDATSPNVYRVTDVIEDDIFEVKSNWRSKQFDFDSPSELKQIVNVYIEGYITSNTDLSISLLLDEDGYTQTFTTTFEGTEEDYIFNSEDFNLFGFSAFGSKRFGSSGESDAKQKFRIYLGKDFRATPFYTAQIEFASEQTNSQWEITNFGFDVRKYSQPIKRELYRSFQ